MSLLKLLRRKNLEYKPQNRLESLLEVAVSDHAARPDFMRQLFHFDLLTIGNLVKHEGDSQSVQFFVRRNEAGIEYVSSFTSKSAIEFAVTQDKDFPKNYVGFKADTLFKMVQNKLGVWLNPGLPFGKFFNPDEVAQILAGEFSSLKVNQIAEQSNFYIGIPKQIPVKFIEVLKDYIGRNSAIDNMYFSLHHTSEPNSLAYRLAVDFKAGSKPAEPSRVFKDIGMIVLDMNLDRPVDMLVADERDKDYFRKGNVISVI